MTDPTPEFLAERFRLSRGESMTAADVVGGKCPKRIARDRGLSLSTIRNQLQFVYLKADVPSQAALSAIAWRAWMEDAMQAAARTLTRLEQTR